MLIIAPFSLSDLVRARWTPTTDVAYSALSRETRADPRSGEEASSPRDSFAPCCQRSRRRLARPFPFSASNGPHSLPFRSRVRVDRTSPHRSPHSRETSPRVQPEPFWRELVRMERLVQRLSRHGLGTLQPSRHLGQCSLALAFTSCSTQSLVKRTPCS